MSAQNTSGTGGAGSMGGDSQLKADLDTMTDKAKDELAAVGEEAKSQFAELKHEAQDQIAAATEKAKGFAGEQKDLAANQLDGVASAISKVADELQGDQSAVAGYAQDLAGGIRKVSETVKGRNVDELMGMVEDFGRQQPVAFLGAAALAGFVASRFMMSSTQRRSQMSGQNGQGAYRPQASGNAHSPMPGGSGGGAAYRPSPQSAAEGK